MSNTTVIHENKAHVGHGHPEIFEVNARLHEREILLLPVCVLGVIENVMVCLIICYHRNLRNTTNVFIFGLCVTNCLFAGILLPMHCFQRTKEIYLYLTIIIILIYICNLTAVTMERFIAITRPLHYINIITKPRAVRIVIACYIMPTLYCLIPIAWKAKQKSIIHKIYIIITLVIFMILPLLFILVVYARVYQETNKFFKKHHSLFSQSRKNNKRQSLVLQEASFLCCLCTKEIDMNSSRRLNSEKLEISESLATSDESLRIRKSSLYKEVLKTQTNSQSLPEETGLVESSVYQNKETDEENSLEYDLVFVQSEELMKGGKNALNRSMSLDDARQRKRMERERKKTDSVLYQTTFRIKTSESLNLDSIKINYLRSYRKAKAKLTELKSSLAFAMVSMTYMFTWLPVVYMTFLEVIDRVQDIPVLLSTISIYTIGLNVMVDPLLYGFLLKDFRRAIKKTLKRKMSKKIKY